MKRKHIIALVVAVAFIGISALALVQNKVDYSDFREGAEHWHSCAGFRHLR